MWDESAWEIISFMFILSYSFLYFSYPWCSNKSSWLKKNKHWLLMSFGFCILKNCQYVLFVHFNNMLKKGEQLNEIWSNVNVVALNYSKFVLCCIEFVLIVVCKKNVPLFKCVHTDFLTPVTNLFASSYVRMVLSTRHILQNSLRYLLLQICVVFIFVLVSCFANPKKNQEIFFTLHEVKGTKDAIICYLFNTFEMYVY